MKKIYLLTITAMATLTLHAQELQTYKGAYGTGVAEYTYTENDKLQRLISGMFSYSDTLTIAGRGECAVKMTGIYKDDKKNAYWFAGIKGMDNESNETVTGPFKDGKKSGLWTHRITVGEKDIKVVSASFYKDRFRNKYSYTYEPIEPVGVYKKLSVTGSFDDKSKFDGEWKVVYTDMNDIEFEDLMRYQHGVLAFRVKRELASGKEISRFDDEAKITAFFAGLQYPDSNSVVGDVKYGVVEKMSSHEIIVPLLKSWNDSRTVNVGNQYASSIPTMMIPRGEFGNPKYLMVERELVLWMDTPKGHKEWLEEQRIIEDYNRKIKAADKALEAKDFEEALTQYRMASKVKKDEDYPQSQIPKVEKMLKDRDTKNRLLESVANKTDVLVTEQKKLTGDETFQKKQKHLFEAYNIAYTSHWKSIRGDHSRVRSNLDNNLIEPITILELELYEADLIEILLLQNKTSDLVGTDTKELEKELKKMESANQIAAKLKK
jgi:hypothetical protein